MKRAAVIIALFAFVFPALAQNAPQTFDLSQYGVKIEPDRRLIVVTMALEAAGLETPISEKGAEFRRRVRADIDGLNPELVQRMKFFVDQNAKRFAERYRENLRREKANDADLKRFDEETKVFNAQFEKYRLRTMSEAERLTFVEQRRGFLNQLVAPYISMAYALGPVPDLAEPARATDLPGDLLEVLDFSPLVRQFYRSTIRRGTEAYTISQKVEEYYKDYQAGGDAMRPSTVAMVRSLLDYLHTRPETVYTEQVKTEVQKGKSKTEKLTRIETRERERRFFIVPDLLAQDATINFRNIGDDYFAIVPPGTDLDDSEVRRAFLQFVLDPIILKNARDILTHRDGIRTLLDERRKLNPQISPDIVLAVSRSLVAAVDAKQPAFVRFQSATAEARRNAGKTPVTESVDSTGRKVVKLTDELFLIDGRFEMPRLNDDVALELYEAYENGAVLSFYFAQQLKGIEESQFDIASAFRDMILLFDPAKESTRLAEASEARGRALALREERRRAAMTLVENPVTKRLTEIEPMIKLQKYAEAETELKKLLDTNPEDQRIYYNLGRVKSLAAAVVTDLDERQLRIVEAKNYFDNVLRLKNEKSDPALISLTFVAVARLYEYFDQDEYAIKLYEEAIKIGEVKGGAFQEAVAARDRLLKKQRQ